MISAQRNSSGVTRIYVVGPFSEQVDGFKATMARELRQCKMRHEYFEPLIVVGDMDLDHDGLVDLATYLKNFEGLKDNCALKLDAGSMKLTLLSYVTLRENLGDGQKLFVNVADATHRKFARFEDLIELTRLGVTLRVAYNLVHNHLWYYRWTLRMHQYVIPKLWGENKWEQSMEESVPWLREVPSSDRRPTIGNLPPYLVAYIVDIALINAIYCR